MNDSSRPLPRGVYYIPAVLLLVLAIAAPAAGQVDISVEPAMTKGAAAAPVTIVEFSDYQ